MTEARQRAVHRSESRRWWVHLGLIGTVIVSLWFEPMLTIHIGVGLAFIGFCFAHLAQRRRVSMNLLKRLGKPAMLLRATPGRLALVDALLAALTIAMLATGLWDWLSRHPTRIRWHAITGVVLAAFLLVHTLRRRRRLRSSHVR